MSIRRNWASGPRWRILALAASAAILSGACSGAAATPSPGGGAGGTAASGAPLSGSISILEKWPEDQYAPYWQSLVQGYEAANPGVKIDLQAVADQPIKDKLTALTAAGQLPDIFFSWAGDFTAKYVNAGLVADLTDPVMNTDWHTKLAGGALAAATYNGKLYGIPIDLDAKFMVYNTKMFQDNGWQVPTSLSDLLTLCDTIKASGKVQEPIAFGNVYGWPAIHYMTQLNAYYVPQATLDTDYNPSTGAFTDSGYVQAFQTLADLNSHCFTSGVNGIAHDAATQDLIQGKAAMMYLEQADFPNLTTANGAPASFADNWDFFQLPFPAEAPGSTTTLEGAPDLFLVNAKTQHMDIVLSFLQYFSDLQNAQQMVKQLTWLSPVLGSATSDNTYAQNIKALNAINSASNMAIWLDTMTAPDVATAYLNDAEAVLGGSKTPAQAMQDIQAAAATAKSGS